MRKITPTQTLQFIDNNNLIDKQAATVFVALTGMSILRVYDSAEGFFSLSKSNISGLPPELTFKLFSAFDGDFEAIEWLLSEEHFDDLDCLDYDEVHFFARTSDENSGKKLAHEDVYGVGPSDMSYEYKPTKVKATNSGCSYGLISSSETSEGTPIKPLAEFLRDVERYSFAPASASAAADAGKALKNLRNSNN